MKHFLPAALVLSLTACGYGWQDEPAAYPPSASQGGAVVQGQGARPVLAGPGEYVVQAGDTLYAIGFRNQIDYHDLAAWNGIGADYLIRPGQLLRLSAPAAAVDSDAVVARPLSSPAPIIAVPQPIAIPAPVPIAVPASDAEPVSASAPPAPAASVRVTPPPPPPRTVVASGTGQRWQWPVSGAVIKTFNPATGSKGIDIAGELGQGVQSVAAGKVVYSGSALKGYGELIIVKHDDNYLSAYGHNRRRLVKEGEEVRAGQTIAELGLGPEQKPLVHFEIRENGKPVDPLAFLPSR